jgi:PAS domain S-box-containing protein
MVGGETMEDEKKMKELEIEDALECARHIIDTVRGPLIIMNENLKVVSASRSFCQVFKVKPEETEGQFIYDLGNHQWDIPRLREFLEDILPETTSFDSFEVEHDFPNIGKRVMLLNGRRIYLQTNRAKLILLAIEDITERKKIKELEAKIKELKADLGRISRKQVKKHKKCKSVRNGFYRSRVRTRRDSPKRQFNK